MKGTRFAIEVRPRLPGALAGLAELAEDLIYSWNHQIRDLFIRLDPDLWHRCGHNPKRFLNEVPQDRLDAAVRDEVFINQLQGVLSAYRLYRTGRITNEAERCIDPDNDLVAYFCAEYGFHESLPVYSGGLGILAGDHCKTASDLGIPFVAVGLFYNQGYFTQTIDSQGNQQIQYTTNRPAELPVAPVCTPEGGNLKIHIALPGREVALQVWRLTAGRIRLYLLDSDLSENDDHDRTITSRLYGGDATMRIQQEMVLGIGGVRALRALGLSPTIWHINEGHAALLILERCSEWVGQGLDFESALECVASSTLFTTHTPVAAGHDLFDPKLAAAHFAELSPGLSIELTHLLGLGVNPHWGEGFSMTALALRGSRFHNGVSREHGRTASEMERYLWSQIPPEENPMGSVTNGVHIPTFLGKPWIHLLDTQTDGQWRDRLDDPEYWSCLDRVPNHRIRSIRKELKAELMADVRQRISLQCRRNRISQFRTQHMLHMLTPNTQDILVLVFARRITQYKRPALIFSDPGRLAGLLNDPQRPVLLIVAGKAHPQDLIGQELIRTIHGFARQPEFEGKIIFLENYDMALSRRLVSGADVLLNTPEPRMEASGTSGMKAGINGVLNLSTPVGWWADGYNGENGWTVASPGPSDGAGNGEHEAAREIYDTLEHQVIPLFFEAPGKGYGEEWIRMVKASMKSIIPGFSSQRMVMNYLAAYYAPAARQGRVMSENGGQRAQELARWKATVAESWSEVALTTVDEPPTIISADESFTLRVAAKLGRLSPWEVTLECLMGDASANDEFRVWKTLPLAPEPGHSGDPVIYRLETKPAMTGRHFYYVRIYPCHKLQVHPFETGWMTWL